MVYFVQQEPGDQKGDRGYQAHGGCHPVAVAIGDGAGPSEAGRKTVGLYHLAWEVDTLAELARLREVLSERGALGGLVGVHELAQELRERSREPGLTLDAPGSPRLPYALPIAVGLIVTLWRA